MLTVYGLKTCDTCRKALKWLKAENMDHRFHDVRADGVAKADVQGWLKQHSADVLINKASTTWRGLDDAARAAIEGDPGTGLSSHPTLIKRPVFVSQDGDVIAVGFKAAQQDALKAAV